MYVVDELIVIVVVIVDVDTNRVAWLLGYLVIRLK